MKTFLLTFFLCFVVGWGCSRNPSFVYKQRTGEYKQTGSYEVPASIVVLERADGTKETTVTAPKTYAPPKPPTVLETEKAKGIGKLYTLAAICAALSVASFVMRHVNAGIIFAAGALAVPLGIQIFTSETVVRFFIGFVCVGSGVFIAWFLVKAKNPSLKG